MTFMQYICKKTIQFELENKTNEAYYIFNRKTKVTLSVYTAVNVTHKNQHDRIYIHLTGKWNEGSGTLKD